MSNKLFFKNPEAAKIIKLLTESEQALRKIEIARMREYLDSRQNTPIPQIEGTASDPTLSDRERFLRSCRVL